MPLGIAVGRRPVLLSASILMIMSAILCATAKTYEWHLGVRMALGVAAGQSEALVPMITQELFFLHERGRCIMIQQTIQTVATAVFVLFASPIGAAIGPGWWYGLGACLSGFSFVLAFFFLPETKYERPLSAYQEADATDEDGGKPVTVCTHRPPLDTVNFKPRTWLSVMRPVVGKPEWWKARDIFLVSPCSSYPA
jgi:MFS family permease